jgi:formylglycine-generating enzyme required for sulfatase activity
MNLLPLLTFALAAEPLPADCGADTLWATMTEIEHVANAYHVVAGRTYDASGYPMVIVLRDGVEYEGRVLGQLCAGDVMESWRGVRVFLQLHDPAQTGTLPVFDGGSRLKVVRTLDGRLQAEVLDGSSTWMRTDETSGPWEAFSAGWRGAGRVGTVGGGSTVRLEVVAVDYRLGDEAPPDGGPPVVRVAVLDEDDGGHHFVDLRRGRRTHRVEAGDGVESTRTALRPLRGAPLAGLLRSLRDDHDAILQVRARAERGAVPYPEVPIAAAGVAFGEREVTLADWLEVMGAPPGFVPGCGRKQDPTLPVTCISEEDAITFANGLSRRNGFTPVYVREAPSTWSVLVYADGYRLPTLEEWATAAWSDPWWPALVGAPGAGAPPCDASAPQIVGVPDAAGAACRAGPGGLVDPRGLGVGPTGLRGMFGNVAERLHCAHGAACVAVGAAWDTPLQAWHNAPRVSVADAHRPLHRLNLSGGGERPDTGLRLVRQLPELSTAAAPPR